MTATEQIETIRNLQRKVNVLEAELATAKRDVQLWRALFEAEIDRNIAYTEVLLGKRTHKSRA